MVAHSVSKRALKVTQLGPSNEQQALMVRIDWTSAQVVKITALENFQMPTVTMWIKKDGYQVLSQQSVPVQAGMTFYFAASNEPGWYYLLRWNDDRQSFSCSCPRGRMQHSCRHMIMAEEHKMQRSAMPIVSDRTEFDGEVRRIELANRDGISTDVVSLDPESGEIYGCTCDHRGKDCKHVQQVVTLMTLPEATKVEASICEAAWRKVMAEPITAEQGTAEYWKAANAREKRAKKAYAEAYKQSKAKLVQLGQAVA